MAENTDPIVSVIVPVRNGGESVRELVEALGLQTLPRARFEVVIGDDGSTDGCTDGLATRDGWLKVVDGQPENSYAARNRAVAVSRGAVLAFVDSDCMPEPQWLEAGLARMAQADLVAGFVRFASSGRPTVWSLLDMDLHLNQGRSVRFGNAASANLFVRRETFLEAGGFDAAYPSNQDYRLVRRCVEAGKKLVFDRHAAVSHPTRDSWRTLLGKIWLIEWWEGYELGQQSRWPPHLLLRLFAGMPLTFYNRWRYRGALSLDTRRLAESGIHVTTWDRLRILPYMYLIVPPVAALATLAGWYRGVRADRYTPNATAAVI
jgi:glycosyltransferase involved in cell wall biosynthesis